MPRFPSIGTALRIAGDTLARFPLALLSALIATVSAIRLIEGRSDDALARLVATAVLGLPLFTASVTSAERRGIAPRHRRPVELLFLAGLVLLLVASLGWSDRLTVLRFAQLLVAAHLLVAVAPYWGAQRLDGFWQFNRILFLRYLVGGFYALVLWAGLSVAVAALDRLFGVQVPGKTYGDLFIVLAFGFHPWFFLAGVPADFDGLERRNDYPAGLKVFAQFVLMPLVAVYLVILTAYLGKVIVTRTWPNGWIGYLVSSVSATGVLALLLVHPLRERSDSRWVDAYGRWWFVALLPSLGMLLAAIAKRVGQYGLTEPRYFLLVLALWLLALALFYGFAGSRNIKLIPMTLCAVALLTSTGPWSAYAVSRRSQVARFGRILTANGMGTPGAVRPAPGPVSVADRRQLSAVLRYLAETHGPDAVAQVMGVSRSEVLAWRDSLGAADNSLAAGAMQRLGLRYASGWEPGNESPAPFWMNRVTPGSTPVRGFEVVRPVGLPGRLWIGTATDSLELGPADSAGVVPVRRGGQLLFTLDVAGAIASVVAADTLTGSRGSTLSAPIVIEGEGGGYRLRLLLESAGGEMRGGRPVWRSASGLLLGSGFLPR